MGETGLVRIFLGLVLVPVLAALWMRRGRRWTDPLFLYVSFSIVLYLMYAFSGAEFYNGESPAGELFFIGALAVSCIGYGVGVGAAASVSAPAALAVDDAFPRKIIAVLMAPMLVSLGILLGALTGGNLLQLFDLSYGNALKWLRVTERSPVVYVSEAAFLACIGVVLPASVLELGRKRRLAAAVSLLAYALYLLSTGSRSPVVAAVLMLIAPMAALRQRGVFTRSIRRLVFGLVAGVLVFFVAVSLNRDEVEDNSNDALRAVFNAKWLGYVAEEKLLPYSLQLPANIVIIYFASTVNNFLIAFDHARTLDHSFGYRLFYTEYKALGLVLPMDAGRAETVLADNTEFLRTVSPTGDQWATSLGTLVLEFGNALAFVASFLQGLAMGWLVRLARRLEPNRRVLLESFLVPVAISAALVHPLMSFSTHIQLFILLVVAAIAARSRAPAALDGARLAHTGAGPT